MPSHPVKWYSSAMPGAPQLRNIAGDLIAVLDWCLVNGSATTAVQSIVVSGGVATVTFASAHTFQKHQIVEIGGVTGALTALNDQWRVAGVTSLALTFPASGAADGTASGTITCKTPGLGWQKAFSGTNKAAYRSQDVTGTQFYLRIDDTTAISAIGAGYESMSGIDTGTGIFLPSGGSTPSASDDWTKSQDSTARPWWIVGDGRTFYYCGRYGTNVYGSAFGDFASWAPVDGFGCLISSGGPSSSAALTIVSTSGGRCYAARSLLRRCLAKPLSIVSTVTLGATIRTR